MNKLLTITPLIAGIAFGAAVSYSDDNQVNRHMISHTVVHVSSTNPDDDFAVTLPMRIGLTLKENSSYDVCKHLLAPLTVSHASWSSLARQND